ncbi:MAG: hypothetical protein GX802_06445 [Clostridiales bacterium]|jgi:hypothetical protein|nr:hypothetical protein [Clostridiales bacterium]
MNETDKNMLGSTIQRAAPIQRAKPGQEVVASTPEPTTEPQPEQQATQSPPATKKPASEVGRRTSKYRNIVDDNFKKAAVPSINSPYAVMPVGWNYGFLLAFAIPVLGFFIAVVWAAGGTRYHNKRNLSIAFVFLQLTLILLLAIGFLVLYSVAADKLDLILTDIKSVIDMFLALFK